jgi:hypothetical protein
MLPAFPPFPLASPLRALRFLVVMMGPFPTAAALRTFRLRVMVALRAL